MKSLFKSEDANSFIERINNLTPQSIPQWGKMHPAQLMAHCAAPFKMAHGEIIGKRGLMGFLFGKIAKKKIVNPAIPFDKNMPTDKKFLFPDANDFEAEKQKLINKIKNFTERGPAGISKEPHSFFGNMTPQDWDILQAKHLDHHLNQFGV